MNERNVDSVAISWRRVGLDRYYAMIIELRNLKMDLSYDRVVDGLVNVQNAMFKF
jgi:hypothetical protein